jgi:hypothetical protein
MDDMDLDKMAKNTGMKWVQFIFNFIIAAALGFFVVFWWFRGSDVGSTLILATITALFFGILSIFLGTKVQKWIKW